MNKEKEFHEFISEAKMKAMFESADFEYRGKAHKIVFDKHAFENSRKTGHPDWTFNQFCVHVLLNAGKLPGISYVGAEVHEGGDYHDSSEIKYKNPNEDLKMLINHKAIHDLIIAEKDLKRDNLETLKNYFKTK